MTFADLVAVRLAALEPFESLAVVLGFLSAGLLLVCAMAWLSDPEGLGLAQGDDLPHPCLQMPTCYRSWPSGAARAIAKERANRHQEAA